MANGPPKESFGSLAAAQAALSRALWRANDDLGETPSGHPASPTPPVPKYIEIEFIAPAPVQLNTAAGHAGILPSAIFVDLPPGNNGIMRPTQPPILVEEPDVTIKSDRWIRRMSQEHGMIEPFIDGQVRDGVISYGNSSYGYDMRIANEFKVFTNVFNTLVDPKHFDPRSFVDITADHCDIPPNSFALARSVEFFRIPRNVLAVCLGKSTYARCGIILNTTPFEPGWRGYVTLELTNSTPLPARIYANEGIGQVLFFESDEECETSYDEKKGKYLDQVGVVPPRL